MSNKHRPLVGKNVLVVSRDVADAINVQHLVEKQGGRALIARSIPGAMLIANNAALSDVVIDFSLSDSDQLIRLLSVRSIPYMFFAGSFSAIGEPAAAAPVSRMGAAVSSCAALAEQAR